MTEPATTLGPVDTSLLVDAGGPDDLPARAVLVVAEEGVQTSDARGARPGALTWRAPPQSLTISHGDVDEIVGRVDRFDRTDSVEGLVPANYADRVGDAGRFVVGLATFDLESDLGREAARMVRDRFLRGVSMEVGDEVVEMEWEQGCDPEAEACVGVEWLASAKIGAVSLVTFPAFESGDAVVDEAPAIPVDVAEPMDPTSIPLEPALVAALSIPPAEWFDDPGLAQPTGIEVDADGRVYGHLAIWGVEHIGLPGRYAQPSPSGYHYFRTGSRMTSEGPVPTGLLTMDTGHENDLYASLSQAVAHYDDTGAQVATVNIGEDQYGIWVAGALLSDVSEAQLERFRASGRLSGDWRPVGRDLELCAALVVNTPGFGVPPTRLALAAGGQPLALVAAPGPCFVPFDQDHSSGPETPETPTNEETLPMDPTAPETDEAPTAPDTIESLRAEVDSTNERVGLLEERLDELESVAAAVGLPAQAVDALVAALGRRFAAVRPHSTPTTDVSWDGPATETLVRSPETPEYFRKIYAWQDDEADPAEKSSWRFIHHEVSGDGTPGAANVSACQTGIGVLNGARGGTTIPDDGLQGVYDHLARHLRDAGVEPAPATFSMRTVRP